MSIDRVIFLCYYVITKQTNYLYKGKNKGKLKITHIKNLTINIKLKKDEGEHSYVIYF